MSELAPACCGKSAAHLSDGDIRNVGANDVHFAHESTI